MTTINDLCEILSEGFGLRRHAVEWLAEEFERRGFTGPIDGPVNIDAVALLLLACTSELPIHPAAVVERFDAMKLRYITVRTDEGEGEKFEAGDPFFDSKYEEHDTFMEGAALTIQAAAQRDCLEFWPGSIRITSTARYHAGVVAIGDFEFGYYASGSEEIGPPIPERTIVIPCSFIEKVADMVIWPCPGPGPGPGEPGDNGEPVDVAA